MTEKLFYALPYQKNFDAVVMRCEQSGSIYKIVLNRTLFYPEGGGQPSDFGFLNDVKVNEVHESSGEIIHYCDAPLRAGETVQGSIDWEHRFDMMQQHSGEHIVSGIVHSLYGYSNVGFHMGKDFITIDFDGVLGEEDISLIQRKANDAICANIPVSIMWPSTEELQAIPYRSKKELQGSVRLVRIPGIDTCACCGTHVAATGEIGMIQLFSCVKFRSGVRIEMLSGSRCLKYVESLIKQNKMISMLLSAKPAETSDAVKRLAEENEKNKTDSVYYRRMHFKTLAENNRGMMNPVLFEPAMASDMVRELCELLVSECSGRCIVFSGNDAEGWKYCMGCKTEDLRSFAKEMNSALKGRGGGKPAFVQGSVSAKKTEIEYFLQK